MCEFCKMDKRDDKLGEVEGINLIGSVKDENIVANLYLMRYACENFHENLLTINSSTESGCLTISKDIPIKYCPFCGEEL